MSTPEFSEFSYGYALTHSLIKAMGTALSSAPIFPSLVQEGVAGGGYDLKLPALPVPLFFQFKIPAVLTRNSKLRPPGYSLPYYRMPLRTKAPNQHELLLQLEMKKKLVYYVAPLFHTINDLDVHFVAADVNMVSTFVLPSQIGALDNSPHNISYQPGAKTYWLRSDPREISAGLGFETLLGMIQEARTRARVEADVSETPPPDTRELLRTSEIQKLVHQLRDLHYGGEAIRTRFEGIFRMSSQRANATPADELFDPEKLGAPSEMARRLAYFLQVSLSITLAFVEGLDNDYSGPHGSGGQVSAPAI